MAPAILVIAGAFCLWQLERESFRLDIEEFRAVLIQPHIQAERGATEDELPLIDYRDAVSLLLMV